MDNVSSADHRPTKSNSVTTNNSSDERDPPTWDKLMNGLITRSLNKPPSQPLNSKLVSFDFRNQSS